MSSDFPTLAEIGEENVRQYLGRITREKCLRCGPQTYRRCPENYRCDPGDDDE